MSVGAIVIAAVMAWLLYRRQNPIAVWIGLAWIVPGAAMTLVSAPGGIVTTLLALPFSINGVRGALAARKASQASIAA